MEICLPCMCFIYMNISFSLSPSTKPLSEAPSIYIFICFSLILKWNINPTKTHPSSSSNPRAKPHIPSFSQVGFLSLSISHILLESISQQKEKKSYDFGFPNPFLFSAIQCKKSSFLDLIDPFSAASIS